MEEFVNTQRWTNMTFQEKERIECSMMLVVKSVQDNMFVCEMSCQSRRPVYGTTYTTPTLNIKDNNFVFTYQEYDQLDFQQSTFTSNLAALMAYYCYLIIGHDMDSFAKLGVRPISKYVRISSLRRNQHRLIMQRWQVGRPLRAIAIAMHL